MIPQIAAIIFLILWASWVTYIYRVESNDWVAIIMLGFLMSFGTMILLLVLLLLLCAAFGVFA